MGQTTLHGWLADRQRTYADGLALFRAHAPEEMKRKYLTYFNEVDTVPQFDSHFTVLINKLTTVARLAGAQPQMTKSEMAAKTIATAVEIAKAVDKASDKVKGDKVLKEILIKESELFALRDRISGLENDNEDKDDEIEELEAELQSTHEELQELQNQFSLLRPGAKIVTYSSLPENIQMMFDRIRKITPLYASMFTEMQNESLTPEQRDPIAKQVHELWLERAGLWDQIDAWAEGKQVKLQVDEKRTEELPADQLLKGMQIANRIERLKENIRRTETSIQAHEKNGKLNLKQKAETRLSEYQKELAELENMK
ncbi:MAG: hypothetical protein PHC95_12040 [Parabacteroides sp.]|nr:hypothetical protein [Parabacteroides sp.]